MTPRPSAHPMQSTGSGAPQAVDSLRDTHERRCIARTRSGTRCRSYAVEGMRVCRMHGGASPQARRAAERRKAEAEATALLELIWDPDAPPVTDPVSALQALAGRLQHAANVLGARLNTADLDGATGLAWARVLRELRQALEGMEKLDLAGKQVELEQAKASIVVAAFQQVLGELQLVPADRDRAVRSFLRGLGRGELAGGSTVAGELA